MPKPQPIAAVVASTPEVIERQKGGNKAPRAKGGKFGTSEAAKRRKAAGINPVPSKAAMSAGIAAAIKAEEPGVPPAVRDQTAKNIAQIVSTSKGLAMGIIDKVRQSLAKNEGIRTIVETVPDAARYIARLVRGEEEGAPHAIRLQAALAVLDISGARLAPMQDDRDLSQLTINELEQRLQGMSLAGESSTIHSNPSHNPADAAPLPPSDDRPALE